jgi:hypothetical protein
MVTSPVTKTSTKTKTIRVINRHCFLTSVEEEEDDDKGEKEEGMNSEEEQKQSEETQEREDNREDPATIFVGNLPISAGTNKVKKVFFHLFLSQVICSF